MIVRNSLGLAAASVWLTTAALARQGEGGIERCAAMASDAERIACLEDLVRQAGEPTAGPGGAPDPLPDSTPEAAPAIAPEVPPANAADMPEETVRESALEEAPEPAPGTGLVSAPSAAAVESEAELGAEQVAVRESRDEPTVIVNAMVVAHTEVGYRKLRVELDNGQVWRQTDGDRQRVIRRLRNQPQFAVEMWATKFGGYRMHIPSENLTIRVERLQ